MQNFPPQSRDACKLALRKFDQQGRTQASPPGGEDHGRRGLCTKVDAYPAPIWETRS